MSLPWPLTAILTHNENFKVFPGFPTFNIFLLYCCHTGSAGHYLSMGLHQVLSSLFLFYPLLPINIADMIFSEPRTNYSSLPGPPLQSKPKYNSWQLLAPCGHSHFNSDSTNSSLALMAYMSFFNSQGLNWSQDIWTISCLECYFPGLVHELFFVSFISHWGLHTLVKTSQLTYFLFTFFFFYIYLFTFQHK